jgi:hypothetical protein
MQQKQGFDPSAWKRRLVAVFGLVAVAITMSGCVVEPYRAGYYHPYRYGYYAY